MPKWGPKTQKKVKCKSQLEFSPLFRFLHWWVFEDICNFFFLFEQGGRQDGLRQSNWMKHMIKAEVITFDIVERAYFLFILILNNRDHWLSGRDHRKKISLRASCKWAMQNKGRPSVKRQLWLSENRLAGLFGTLKPPQYLWFSVSCFDWLSTNSLTRDHIEGRRSWLKLSCFRQRQSLCAYGCLLISYSGCICGTRDSELSEPRDA